MLDKLTTWMTGPPGPSHGSGNTVVHNIESETQYGEEGDDEASEYGSPRADSQPDDESSPSPVETQFAATRIDKRRSRSPHPSRTLPEPRPTRHSSDPHRGCEETILHLQKEVEKLAAHIKEREDYFEQAKKEWEDTTYHDQIKAAREYSRLADMVSEKDRTIAALKETKPEPHREPHRDRNPLFTTLDDRCSGADVTALVQALNYEILQVSTAAAEVLAAQYSAKGKGVAVPVDKEGLSKWMEGLIGSRFHSELEAANHKEDNTLLQLAFQAVLCSYCKRFIDSWDKESSKDLSTGLEEIYKMMKKKEPQSVFAHWRTLTQRQLNDIVAEKKPIPLATKIRKRILDVALAANIHYSEQISEWARTFTDKLYAIESHVGLIKNAITLDFVSGDFIIVHVRSGKSFDSREMRNAFESDQDSKSDRVACTTELGLRLTKKVMKRDQSYEESHLLLEPQVFLDSTLHELVQS